MLRLATAAVVGTAAVLLLLRRRSSHARAMSPTLLCLAAKSGEEQQLAQALKRKLEQNKGLLQISDQEKEVKVCMKADSDECEFRAEMYMDLICASKFGRFLVWSPRLSSTHDLVSKNFDEIPVGTVCVTDVQFKGRGRSKNVWESPMGCLLFSFTLQMQDGKKLPLLQYIVSLAITESIKQLCQDKGLEQIDLRIKWPNDLYLEGLKVGGVLCTSSYHSKFFNVSAGVGLNVDNENPTTCLNAVIRKMNPNSVKLEREEILATFFNKFEDLFDIFVNQGFHVLEDLYCKTWLHSGQKVVIEENNDKVEVTIQGLTPAGYLLATDEENKSYELHPDGNSFDFFKGLVRRKLQ
ncbi:hypothetical protein LUZ60_017347 [Juncus effusus]|nr:hypothetical protein LUZ60_017347 [Juncus effusus]